MMDDEEKPNDPTQASKLMKKAPPKMAPPSSAPPSSGAKDEDHPSADSKGADSPDGKKKKKALPPPSNPPPQAASAAAAFRAKSSMAPPNGPPPNGGTASASVAKIRGAVKPPSSSTPPLNETSSSNAPPTTAPPKMAPPKMAPPSISTPAKTVAKEDEEKKLVDNSDRKITRMDYVMADHSTNSSGGSSSSNIRRSSGSKAFDTESPRTNNMERNYISSDIITSTTAATTSMRPSTSTLGGYGLAYEVVTSGNRAPARSTIEVLHHTSSLLTKSKGGSGGGPLSLSSDERSMNTTTNGFKAAPLSGMTRVNLPDEEVIVVATATKKNVMTMMEEHTKGGSGKSTLKAPSRHDLEDSIEDVEEIPFLNESKMSSGNGSEEDRTYPIYEHSRRRNKEEKDYKEDSVTVVEGEKDNKVESTTKTISRHHIAETKEPVAAATTTTTTTKMSTLTNSSHHNDSKSYEDTMTTEAKTTIKEEEFKQYPQEEEQEENKEKRREKRREKKNKTKQNKKQQEQQQEQQQQQQEQIKRKFECLNPKNVPFVPDHLLDFVRKPLENGRGTMVKCFIERNETGQNKLAPLYTLLLEINSSSGRPIMYARKKISSRITSHYVISMNKEDLFLPRNLRSHQYIGKLRSSTNMMEYCLYDQGDNPEDLDSDCEIDEEMRKNIRAELAVIRYHNTKKAYARKMEIAIPAISIDGKTYLDWRPVSHDQMMEEHFRAITAAGGQNVLDANNFVFMHKRETKYDPLSSCIVDFRSRATCVSVKNFQLVHSIPANEQFQDKYRVLHPEYAYQDQGTVSLPQEHVMLQLGKVGKDCFNMDFQYPLSMLQAFAISLSRFDTKQR